MSSTVRSNSVQVRRLRAGARTRRRSRRCSPAASPLAVAQEADPRALDAAGATREVEDVVVEQRVVRLHREAAAAHRDDRQTVGGRPCSPMLPSALIWPPAPPPTEIPCDDDDRLRGDARAVPPDRPARLVRGRPRRAGFDAGFMVSEHFHPWTPQQGQSAFAWSFMGALGTRTIAAVRDAVTCPGFRYHPAVIAHAAATLGAMFPGRFWLGLGAGEALNEHVVGGEWPEIGDPLAR